MSEQQDTGGVLWDAPNQQVVRSDASAPWDEGTGGEAEPDDDEGASSFDAMTKDDLLSYARANDIPANASQSKAEIREAIEDAEG